VLAPDNRAGAMRFTDTVATKNEPAVYQNCPNGICTKRRNVV